MSQARITVENAQKLAARHGGIFLSTIFSGASSRYLWQCKNGHKFEAFYYNVHSGKWCRECRNNSLRNNPNVIWAILLEKKLSLISDINLYKNEKTLLTVVCKECNRRFDTNVDKIRKCGCPKCAKVNSFKQIITNACQENNFEIIDFNNCKCSFDKVLIKYKDCGHICSKTIMSIRGRPERSESAGCKECLLVQRLDTAKSIASNNGGKCLSSKYKSGKMALQWECVRGHQWFASFDNVCSKNSWCPDCN